MLEHYFQCPHCWSEISMLLDSSIRKTNYIEDCEVCCNPIELSCEFNEGTLTSFDIKSIEQ